MRPVATACGSAHRPQIVVASPELWREMLVLAQHAGEGPFASQVDASGNESPTPYRLRPWS